MKQFYGKEKRVMKQRLLSVLLVFAMVVGSVLLPTTGNQVAKAAETTITSMAYFSANDGPVISKSGVGSQSYGFVMPIFNGGAASWSDVANDLTVYVKVNNNWVNIDNTSFAYNVNWGNWSDGGFNGYWFVISETTYLRLASKTNNVTLDYTLEFTNIPTSTITSMTATQGPELTAGVTGGIGFTYPIFNGNASIPYEAVKDDLVIYVKPVSSSSWVRLFNNAASGWIYDQNFGQFTDGGGGLWFNLTQSIHVKFESISTGATLIYTLNYNEPVRNSYTLTPYDGTTYTAGESGAIGIPLPKIDSGAPVSSELDKFVYQIKINGEWVDLSDYSKSGFSYSGNGYNNLSDKNQWGYWVDYIYGLWFQPIQVNYELRIGYPTNGVKGGAIGNNYVYYNFIGNPNAPRPDMSDLGDIELGTPNNPDIPGNVLIWNDEFSSANLDMSKWNYVTGYYINDDPGTWGWGNNELEFYTDSTRNVYIADNKLNITAYAERRSFPQDPNRYAEYSSGKITTKDKFTFQYGRIDFRAKLPRGTGLWPALWLLPNDDTYGTWAASGEIDVMEARGRLPQASSGAIHFGGTWPANTYIGGDYAFPEGQSIDSDFHVYSLVWEEDTIKWYVDGKCFYRATSEQWYSNGAPNDPNAPFDQPFYIIMNLAVGGWFDGGLTPGAGDIPATMQVDYVRVYKTDGSPDIQPIPVQGMTLDQTEITLTSAGQTTTLTKTFTPANATNKNVTWTSSNPSVATVNAGQVTAISNGTAIITATSVDGGFTSSCQVTVNIQTQPQTVPVTGVSLNQTSAELTIGSSVQLSATVAPSNATNKSVSWSVDNSSIATIDQTGRVTGVSAGTTNVTVRTADGNKTASCQITVKAENIEFIVGDEVKGLRRINDTIEFYVKGASFADVHYKINNGGQINVGMTSNGNGNYSYRVNNLKQGDIVDYFFTYNPGQGALDSQWFKYIHGVTQGTTENPNPTPTPTPTPSPTPSPTPTPTPGTDGNVAAGKSVTCSGLENASMPASYLTDGNTGTRYSSNYADDAWFIIDLEQTYSIQELILNWEAAYGRQYEILVSENGVNYTRAALVTNGSGGIERINLNSVNGRYVKFQGIQRALPYGYSLWDVQVIGSTPSQPLVFEKISSNKTVVTSSNESASYGGSNVVDDNLATRWSSAFSDNEWIYIDLGVNTKVNKVILNWEAAYGKSYQIQLSTNSVNWTTVATINNSDGGIDEINFNVADARYVRMVGLQRALPYGYSLYEMEVYGVRK